MDMPKLFSIGDVAKLFHISVSSLRHYEDLGLLTFGGKSKGKLF